MEDICRLIVGRGGELVVVFLGEFCVRRVCSAATHRCFIRNRNRSSGLTNHVAIVSISAVTHANAGLWIPPPNLSARTGMAECCCGVGVAKAAMIAIFVSGNDHSQGTVDRDVS